MASNLKIKVTADTAQAKTSVSNLTKQIDKTKAGSKTAGLAGVSSFAAMATAATAAVAGAKKLAEGITDCVNVSNEFNKSMANIATLIPNSSKRIAEMSDNILDLSITTGKATGDLTEGAYQVISAFGDSADTMDYLEISANGATAGMASTEEMLNLISATMKGYGNISVEAANRTSDLAFQTVKLGQTSIPALSSAIMKVTANSSKLGITQEELYSTFATLTGVTGEAAEVSTQLRATQTALLSPTDSLIKAYESMGISSSEAMLEQNGLAGSMKLIAEYATANNIPLQDLVGSTEAMTFVSAIGTIQNETYNEKLKEMGTASGSTNEALNEVKSGVNSLGFEIDQNKSKWEKLKVKIGQDFSPVASVIVGSLGDLLDVLNDDSSAMEDMKTSTTDLITATSDYKTIVEQLNGKLSEQKRNQLELLKIQKELEMKTLLNNFSDSYDDVAERKLKLTADKDSSQKSMDAIFNNLKNLARSYDIEFDTDVSFGSLLSEVEKISPRMAKITNDDYSKAMDKNTEATDKLNLMIKEEAVTMDMLSKSVADEVLNIDALKFSNKPLYDSIMANVEAYAKEEAAIKARNEAAIIKELNTPEKNPRPTSSSTADNDDEIKDNSTVIEQFKLQNDLLNAKTEIEKLEINRAAELAKYTEKEVDARNVINEYYNNQKALIEEELAQKEQSNKLDEQKETALLVYNDLVAQGASFEELKQAKINSLIAEKNKALADAVETYGKESVYAKSLEKSYDDQIAKEKESKEINTDIADFINSRTELLSKETQKKEQINEIDTEILEAQELLKTAKDGEKAKIEEIIKSLEKEKDLLSSVADSAEPTWADDIMKALDPNDTATEFKETWEETFGSLADTFGDYANTIIDGISSIVDAQLDADQSILDNKKNLWDKEKEGREEEIAEEKESSDELVDALKTQYEAGALTYEDYLTAKTDAQAAYNELKDALDEESKEKEASQLAEQNEIDKKRFDADKKNKIAQIWMDTASAVIKGYSQLGFWGGSAFAATVLATAGIQSSAVSKQQFVPALAEGGVATKPTMALIGEGGEPEMVLPLSKAKEQGFGGSANHTIIINLNGKAYLSKDEVYEAIYDGISKAQKIGKIKQW